MFSNGQGNKKKKFLLIIPILAVLAVTGATLGVVLTINKKEDKIEKIDLNILFLDHELYKEIKEDKLSNDTVLLDFVNLVKTKGYEEISVNDFEIKQNDAEIINDESNSTIVKFLVTPKKDSLFFLETPYEGSYKIKTDIAKILKETFTFGQINFNEENIVKEQLKKQITKDHFLSSDDFSVEEVLSKQKTWKNSEKQFEIKGIGNKYKGVKKVTAKYDYDFKTNLNEVIGNIDLGFFIDKMPKEIDIKNTLKNKVKDLDINQVEIGTIDQTSRKIQLKAKTDKGMKYTGEVILGYKVSNDIKDTVNLNEGPFIEQKYYVDLIGNGKDEFINKLKTNFNLTINEDYSISEENKNNKEIIITLSGKNKFHGKVDVTIIERDDLNKIANTEKVYVLKKDMNSGNGDKIVKETILKNSKDLDFNHISSPKKEFSGPGLKQFINEKWTYTGSGKYKGKLTINVLQTESYDLNTVIDLKDKTFIENNFYVDDINKSLEVLKTTLESKYKIKVNNDYAATESKGTNNKEKIFKLEGKNFYIGKKEIKCIEREDLSNLTTNKKLYFTKEEISSNSFEQLVRTKLNNLTQIGKLDFNYISTPIREFNSSELKQNVNERWTYTGNGKYKGKLTINVLQTESYDLNTVIDLKDKTFIENNFYVDDINKALDNLKDTLDKKYKIKFDNDYTASVVQGANDKEKIIKLQGKNFYIGKKEIKCIERKDLNNLTNDKKLYIVKTDMNSNNLDQIVRKELENRTKIGKLDFQYISAPTKEFNGEGLKQHINEKWTYTGNGKYKGKLTINVLQKEGYDLNTVIDLKDKLFIENNFYVDDINKSIDVLKASLESQYKIKLNSDYMVTESKGSNSKEKIIKLEGKNFYIGKKEIKCIEREDLNNLTNDKKLYFVKNDIYGKGFQEKVENKMNQISKIGKLDFKYIDGPTKEFNGEGLKQHINEKWTYKGSGKYKGKISVNILQTEQYDLNTIINLSDDIFIENNFYVDDARYPLQSTIKAISDKYHLTEDKDFEVTDWGWADNNHDSQIVTLQGKGLYIGKKEIKCVEKTDIGVMWEVGGPWSQIAENRIYLSNETYFSSRGDKETLEQLAKHLGIDSKYLDVDKKNGGLSYIKENWTVKGIGKFKGTKDIVVLNEDIYDLSKLKNFLSKKGQLTTVDGINDLLPVPAIRHDTEHMQLQKAENIDGIAHFWLISTLSTEVYVGRIYDEIILSICDIFGILNKTEEVKNNFKLNITEISGTGGRTIWYGMRWDELVHIQTLGVNLVQSNGDRNIKNDMKIINF